MRSASCLMMFALGCAWATHPLANSSHAEYHLVAVKGLAQIEVVLDVEGAQLGFDRTTIKTDAEIRLRLAGIEVVREGQETPVTGVLYIRILAERVGSRVVTFIMVEFQQNARLFRDPSVVVPLARMWHSDGNIGVSQVGDTASVRQWIKDGVDEFINLYLAANPPKPAQKDE